MTKKIIKKRRVEDPIVFTGKILRELAEDPNLTLAKFKKRYCLRNS